MFSTVVRYLRGNKKETAAAPAYDLWAATYDDQPDNLMLALDEELFGKLATDTLLEGKHITDVGCGTGRHWAKIFASRPASLTGYDVSEGMLNKLKVKYPAADTYLLSDDKLVNSGEDSCDIVISTLTIAHIENIKEAMKEWNRVLRAGGKVIITDFHPEQLAKGGARTFSHGNRAVTIKNYVHPLNNIIAIGAELGWELIQLEERKIGESVRSFYEKKNALHVYERFEGMPVIFGMRLKKKV